MVKIMDGFDDDAYGAIYDEHDRERTDKPAYVSNYGCCGILPVFIVIAVIAMIF